MTQIGKLPPLYRFILNPHEDVRFSSCPECSQRTLLRKVPLVVHVDPLHPVVLNKKCRYCPDCDILIAHQDELEQLLAYTFQERAPNVIGNEYLILGTVDKATWRKQRREPIHLKQLPEYLHDFKEYLNIKYSPGGWQSPDQASGQKEAPDPVKTDEGQSISTSTKEGMPGSPVSTIDDSEQVKMLLAKMEANLPIPAEVRRATATYLRNQGSIIPPHRQLSISAVFYHGDDGGIMCGISPQDSKEPIVISLTQLKIPYHHPLEKEIRAYQKARRRKISQS